MSNKGESVQGKGQVVVIGGTNGIGQAIAEALVKRGDAVVIAGRSNERAEAAAEELGQSCSGLAVDLTRPDELGESLSAIEAVSALILTAAEPNDNPLSSFDSASAARIASIKLTGYTAAIAALASRMSADSAVLMFGGNAKDRPYPGSTTLTTVNAGLAGLVRALAIELAPVRVNAIHPGVVSDSPAWIDADPSFLAEVRESTPSTHLTTMKDVVDASLFTLSNPAVNAANISLDGGASIL